MNQPKAAYMQIKNNWFWVIPFLFLTLLSFCSIKNEAKDQLDVPLFEKLNPANTSLEHLVD